MTVDSSAFSRRIQIEKRATGADASGDQAPQGWTPHRSAWCDPRMASGMSIAGELGAADTTVSRSVGSFRVRWCTDLDATMRVVYRGAVYNIAEVIPDLAGREYVDLVVSTGANEG